MLVDYGLFLIMSVISVINKVYIQIALTLQAYTEFATIKSNSSNYFSILAEAVKNNSVDLTDLNWSYFMDAVL